MYFSVINLTWRKAHGLKQNHLYVTFSVIYTARLSLSLFFSTFQYHFLSCSHTGWAEVCKRILGIFSLQTPVAELWLTAQHDRRHLNCLITDPGCDRLSFPERYCRRALWAEVQLLYLVAVPSMCACKVTECLLSLHGFIEVDHQSNISCCLAFAEGFTAGQIRMYA